MKIKTSTQIRMNNYIHSSSNRCVCDLVLTLFYKHQLLSIHILACYHLNKVSPTPSTYETTSYPVTHSLVTHN